MTTKPRKIRLQRANWRDRWKCDCGCERAAEYAVDRNVTKGGGFWRFYLNRKCLKKRTATLIARARNRE